MRVVRDLSAAKARPSCVTFGVFDGVHLGHRALLERTVEVSRHENLRSVAVTFEPIPEAVLHPGAHVAILTPVAEKRALIRDVGLQLLIVAPFDEDFSRICPVAFLRDILHGQLGARAVVAGPRTRFGWRGQGNLALMQRRGPELGLRVESVPEVRVRGTTVSSTAIRLSLAQGRMAAANKMLGRLYSLTGRVVHGAGRGRGLGFPTFNLSLPADKALPAYGVYAGYALAGDRPFPAAIYIGDRPTFVPRQVAIEAHTLGPRVPPRVRSMTFQLLRKLRGDRAFASPGLLARQMGRDCARARRLLMECGGLPPP